MFQSHAIITDVLQEMNYIILLRIIEFSPFTGTADIQHWTIHHSQNCNRIKFKSTSRRKAVIISARLLTTIRNRTVFYRYLSLGFRDQASDRAIWLTQP